MMNEKFRILVKDSGLPLWATEGNHKVQVASRIEALINNVISECCEVLEKTQNGNGVKDITEHFYKNIDNIK